MTPTQRTENTVEEPQSLGLPEIGEFIKRWRIPVIYFAFCELLDLCYELGLARLMIDWVWVVSAGLLVVITLPALGIGQWVDQHVSMFLEVPLHSFWPRLLSVQSVIIACTLMLAFLVLIFFTIKDGNQSTNP